MNEEYRKPETGPDDELSTTPPNPTAPATGPGSAGGWVMPTPVFRKTSGQLPRRYERRAEAEMFEMFEDTTAVPNKVREEAAELATSSKERPPGAAGNPAPNVEPQPEISEESGAPFVVDAARDNGKSKTGLGRILVVFLFFAAVAAVVAAVLMLVTYLFFLRGGESTF